MSIIQVPQYRNSGTAMSRGRPECTASNPVGRCRLWLDVTSVDAGEQASLSLPYYHYVQFCLAVCGIRRHWFTSIRNIQNTYLLAKYIYLAVKP